MQLVRKVCALYGVTGELKDGSKGTTLVTLEHAYEEKGKFSPKLQDGQYICKRSMHRLSGMTNDFETFQIMDVPGHSNILFHWGNYNNDSEGCVLLGAKLGVGCILDSRLAFSVFLQDLVGADEFPLTVSTAFAIAKGADIVKG